MLIELLSASYEVNPLLTTSWLSALLVGLFLFTDFVSRLVEVDDYVNKENFRADLRKSFSEGTLIVDGVYYRLPSAEHFSRITLNLGKFFLNLLATAVLAFLYLAEPVNPFPVLVVESLKLATVIMILNSLARTTFVVSATYFRSCCCDTFMQGKKPCVIYRSKTARAGIDKAKTLASCVAVEEFIGDQYTDFVEVGNLGLDSAYKLLDGSGRRFVVSVRKGYIDCYFVGP